VIKSWLSRHGGSNELNRNPELTIAESADSDCWDGSKPLEHSKPALFHSDNG